MTRALRLAVLTSLSLITVAGCDLQSALDGITPSQTLVNVSVTHHGTPTAAGFPDHGGEGETRRFDSDEGWTILLTSAYVVTTQLSLERCDTTDMNIESYWGAVAEDIRGADLELHTVGGIELADASLCRLKVRYAPYTSTNGARSAGPADIDGATVFFAGGASRGDEVVPFTVRSTATIDVDLDLSQLDGGRPVIVSGKEDFPVELDVSKTYDRLFDGIDFSAFADEAELDATLTRQVEALLAMETRVGLGGVSSAVDP